MLERIRGACVLALMGVSAAACSDSTGARPGQFNAMRVEAGVAAVERAADAPVLRSLDVVARGAADVGTTQSTVVGVQSGSRLETAVRGLATATTDAATALIPIMQASVLGKTFVYDPGTRTYVPDPSRTGAPPNGIRFVLYETTAAGEPILTSEAGYADLTDDNRSSATTAGVRLVVVTGGVTRLSYSFELTGSFEAAAFDVRGFLTDGSERLEFAIKTSQQLFGQGGTATLDATLTVPQHDFVVNAKAQGTAGESNGDGQIDLTIKSGVDEIIVDAQTLEGQLDATFTVNGKLLATATGDPQSPTIRGEGGRELTEEELHALVAIVAMAGNLFMFVAGLLQPAGVLLLIAMGVS